MYLKITRVKDKKTNIKREYLRIAETYREKGKWKQRIIAHLGRVDLISKEQLLNISRKLAKIAGEEVYTESDLEAKSSLYFGPILILRKIWDDLRLGEIIKEECKIKEVAERIFVIVCSRLLQPESEHGLSYFLKEYYVWDDRGRRWEPEFKEDLGERGKKGDGEDRVKVEWRKLQRWYRALDKLIENKERIELRIYERVKDLFSLKVDIVFYDITSTYFEGKGPKELAKFGYSRDGKKDKLQILLGIVMANGFPIAHHVFAGNTADKETLEFVIKDLKERFEINNIILVADKGINTVENTKKLDELGYKYILGVSLRNSKEAKGILERIKELKWEEYDKTTKYAFVEVEEGGKIERWILVDSLERKGYERRMREAWMERGARELQELKKRVKSGKLKDERKIAYYLGSISRKNHIRRYFDWEIRGGGLRFWVSEEKIEFEERCEGKYLLKTTEEGLTVKDIIREYKNLWEVESCFREIKDVIKIRPIYHQREERAKAHIFSCVLAYLVEEVLERRVRSSGMKMTAQDVLEFLKGIKVVEIEAGGKRIKLISQEIDRVAREVLNIFGLKILRSFEEGKISNFIDKEYVQRRLFD